MKAQRSSVSVVVPVYNADHTIETLVHRLTTVLRARGGAFEIVLVNDGSRDHSWTKVQQLGSVHPEVVGINLMRNYGQHNALLCGIRAARHDITVTLDDDLQQPPEEIPVLLDAVESGLGDVVYGTPTKERHGVWRNMASRLVKTAMKSALGAEIAPMVSTFRAFRTDLRTAFDRYQSPLISIDVLLSWATNRFAAVPVARAAREHGKSAYSFRGLARHALNMVTGFSVLPLQIATVVGFVSMLFGAAVLLFVLARYLLGSNSPPGFPFLASIITIFAGAQLFALGIIGEYLGRMHLRTMERPPYAIRDQMGGGARS